MDVVPMARPVDISGIMNRLAVALALVTTSACSAKSVVVHRPEDPDVDAAITALWTHEVETIARDGDWILSRAYFATSDLITSAVGL